VENPDTSPPNAAERKGTNREAYSVDRQRKTTTRDTKEDMTAAEENEAEDGDAAIEADETAVEDTPTVEDVASGKSKATAQKKMRKITMKTCLPFKKLGIRTWPAPRMNLARVTTTTSPDSPMKSNGTS
jgi:type III secretory pathway component EscV